MPAPSALLQPDGRLSDTAVLLFTAVCGVDEALLRAARVRPASRNWLRAPWYPNHRGGGLTIGRTIWLTRKYFAADGWGNEAPGSILQWTLLLAHEVGHLPQAERMGLHPAGQIRYVLHFTWAYSWRAIRLKRDVHDGVAMEIEADRGRKVLAELLRTAGSTDALLQALRGTPEDMLALLIAWKTPLHGRS